MEPLISAIVKVAPEIAKAARTARRNSSRCLDLAERAGNVGDLLYDSTVDKDTTTRTMVLVSLSEALGDVLRLVESCRRDCWFWRLLAASRDVGRFGNVDVPLPDSVVGRAILEEKIHVGSAIGSALIVAWLYMVLWGKGREMSEPADLDDDEVAAATEIITMDLELNGKETRNGDAATLRVFGTTDDGGATSIACLHLLAVLLSAMVCAAAAQPATAEAAPVTPEDVGIKVSFRPSIAIVIGIFTMIFSLTFLLLMYAKFCQRSSSPLPTNAPPDNLPVADANVAGNDTAQPTGVAKPVIESLPFFRFAALRGARQGLECAVCLSRFDDADLLRLLPRCRHAFHLDCVDRWLESNASCPLCRARVDADDAAVGLKYAASARFVFGCSGRFDAPDPGAAVLGRDLLDIFVERVPPSRFVEEQEKAPAQCLDRHRHRIMLSDVVFKSRWSDLNSADLIALDTEMLRSMSSGWFPSPDDGQLFTAEEPKRDDGMVVCTTIMEEMEKKRLLESKASVMGTRPRRGGGVGGCSSSEAVDAGEPTVPSSAARMMSSGVRSMSEIVSLSRLRAAVRERLTEEERARRRWLPIARRTARWLAGRQRRYVKGGAPEVEDMDASSEHRLV